MTVYNNLIIQIRNKKKYERIKNMLSAFNTVNSKNADVVNNSRDYLGKPLLDVEIS